MKRHSKKSLEDQEKEEVKITSATNTLTSDDKFQLKPLVLPLIGILLFAILFIGRKSPEIIHIWDTGDVLCDSSKRIQDSAERMAVLEKGGALLKQQIALHPYHARIWAMLGHYYIQKKDWDSTIYSEKKALQLGSGTKVNSIESMANQYLTYALSQKLQPYFSNKEMSLSIIKTAEVEGYDNIILHKYKGLAYANDGNLDSASFFLKSFLAINPKDFDALYAISLAYIKGGKQKEAIDYYNQAQQVVPGNPRLAALRTLIYP